MKIILLAFPLLVLLGLVFVMFIGRRRRPTSDGVLAAPAPGSHEAPIIGEPEEVKTDYR